MPTIKRAKRRRRRPRASGILATVGAAREAAADAMRMLRGEIRQLQARLEKLMESERSFRVELFGDSSGKGSERAARRRKRGTATSPTHRKGPPIADRFFKRLPKTFTLDDIRKVAGRLTGVSVAQWSRAKKVRKRGKKYEKTGPKTATA